MSGTPVVTYLLNAMSTTCRILVTLIAVSSVADTVSKHVHEISEVCHFETFHASCGKDEVVVIQRALYGRMRLGRCVQTDFGFVGCYADVLDIIDSNCSGRHACTFDVVDPNFQGLRPCNYELKSYLEVEFKCVKVPKPSDENCLITLEENQYIPNILGEETLCGTSLFPWKVSVNRGQTIHVFLMDFSAGGQASPGQQNQLENTVPQADFCYRNYGRITEPDAGQVSNICGGVVRERDVYITSTNYIELELSYPKSAYFLIYMKVIGCPLLKTSGAVIVKHQDRKTVLLGCKYSTYTWHLRCQGNKWEGPSPNCSTSVGVKYSKNEGGAEEEQPRISSAISAGIAIGVACVMSGAVVTAGIFCTKRLMKGSLRMSETDPSPAQGTAGDCERCERPLIENLDQTPQYMSSQIYYATRKDLANHRIVLGEPCYCLKPMSGPGCGTQPLPTEGIYQYGSTSKRDMVPADRTEIHSTEFTSNTSVNQCPYAGDL